MSDASLVEWYYVGHYGQLGPLTLDQMKELVRDGVIERQTFVWHTGRTQWTAAETFFELRVVFEKQAPAGPPPMPTAQAQPRVADRAPYQPPATSQLIQPYHQPAPMMPMMGNALGSMPESDRSRVVAGILQIIIPGVGRMYLGYYAIGFVQLLSVPICAVGWFWSIIDGVAMIMGSPKFDGFGRRLTS